VPRKTGSVTDKAASLREFAQRSDRRKAMVCRQLGELVAPAEEKGVVDDHLAPESALQRPRRIHRLWLHSPHGLQRQERGRPAGIRLLA
jgi:hypothetical protein